MNKRTWTRSCTGLLTLAFLITLLTTAGAGAQVAAVKSPDVAAKAYRHADLDISAERERLGDLPAAAAGPARARATRIGANLGSAFLDKRSGRLVTMMPEGVALVPGRGNNLTWGDLGFSDLTPDLEARELAARDAFLGYLSANQSDLRIDARQLGDARMASHDDGDLFQFYLPRYVGGIRVEGSYITAVVGQGNLSLMSINTWGDVRQQIGQRLSAAQAMDAALDYLSPLGVEREWGKPELLYVPMAKGHGLSVARGDGYRHELVWSIKVQIRGDQGNWELWVDQRGNVLKIRPPLVFEKEHAELLLTALDETAKELHA